ncbi:hypothetical protein [Mycolicibacterium sediminis]|nr:hypothetical protein [Mycolicibacterium sediminis]
MDADVRRRRTVRTMPSNSPTDAALRRRLTELCVHIPCGGIRGPIQRPSLMFPKFPVRWQSCRDEDFPEKWEGHDVSRHYDLCVICFRATAGGCSRWAWLACNECRVINESIGCRWGFRPFALGRHSLMNGIGVRNGSSEERQAAALQRLAEFRRGDRDIRNWRRVEYRRMAASFDPLADVPLAAWQQEWPPSASASADAFARLLGN